MNISAILYYPSNIGYLKYVFLLNQSYKLFIQKKESMRILDSKLSKSSAYIYRPLTTHTNSPHKFRENNFLLDCTNRETSTLPVYKPQSDEFTKPYVMNLLHKVKSQNLQSSPNLKIKQNFKIRQNDAAPIQAQQFKSFLANQIKAVLQNMEQFKNNDFSSARNSPQKENMRKQKKQKKSKQKFLEKKFSTYKIRSRKWLSSKNMKKSDSIQKN